MMNNSAEALKCVDEYGNHILYTRSSDGSTAEDEDEVRQSIFLCNSIIKVVVNHLNLFVLGTKIKHDIRLATQFLRFN